MFENTSLDFISSIAREAVEVREDHLVFPGGALLPLSARGAGVPYVVFGETSKAIEFSEKRIEIAREIGDRRGTGNALGNLGKTYATMGDTRKAIDYYFPFAENFTKSRISGELG